MYCKPGEGSAERLTSRDQLTGMSQVDVTTADKSSLVNLKSVTIDTSLPVDQRIEAFLDQVKNPYVFLCGETPVRVTFKKDGNELGGILQKYFSELKDR
jgi:hypothetical protein